MALQCYYNCPEPIDNGITMLLQLPIAIHNSVTVILQFATAY